ncbi:MAG TPA: hypothetical protein P5234_03115 [Thermoanaerobaculaceae bacterium]|nr:hypothetical protein [Thermoanaerobaculaceae bacterium]HRS15220.1 hypothetical protein [Thermoanaerobaculaceae bacterium]
MTEPARVWPASCPYGHFSDDGREYVVTDPRPPRPWCNVIANPRFGLVVSQAGGGFTFVDNSQLAVLTRWQQDLNHDNSGKFLFLVDLDTGERWSAAPAPLWPAYETYRCRHGLGYTVFETERQGVAVSWTLFAHAVETAEIWIVEITNLQNRPRRLDLVSYLEWNCGVAPAPRREFQKLFLETAFDPARRAVLATAHMWEVPNRRFGHWNTSFPYWAALACSAPLDAATGDKAVFCGRGRGCEAPHALDAASWPALFGRHHDPVAALRSRVELAPRAHTQVVFTLVAGGGRGAAEALVDRLCLPDAAAEALAQARDGWRDRLAGHRIATPDPALDALANDWVRYQAIGGRMWARAGYYQQSGAYGFRDQLQDSQVWLHIEPERCRAQIRLHAAHQFADGSVYHWWHPLSEQGHVTRMTDDLLWLGYVIASYLRETADWSVLEDPAPFLDDPTGTPLREHVARAFRHAFGRFSPRGLPLIGAGDWNDGLSAAGLDDRGESVWLGHFLAGLLADWAEIAARTGHDAQAAEYRQRRAALLDALNAHGWDGQWYLRGTLDDGTPFGSATNRVGRIYLNAQTWAVLADVAPPERAAACMAAVKAHLVSEAGALLLAPAYDEPIPEIGYITRYAPGLRENGGVYTHAATWAIAAAAKVRDTELVGRLLDAINPVRKNPERYWAEPYVLPGNVDGPDSPFHGRAGWTWYTGSAAWLHRVVTHWVLGVRPEWDGLRLDPCLPPGWEGARMTRPWRGATYEIVIVRDPAAPSTPTVTLDGVRLPGNVLPPPAAPGLHHAEVRFSG